MSNVTSPCQSVPSCRRHTSVLDPWDLRPCVDTSAGTLNCRVCACCLPDGAVHRRGRAARISSVGHLAPAQARACVTHSGVSCFLPLTRRPRPSPAHGCHLTHGAVGAATRGDDGALLDRVNDQHLWVVRVVRQEGVDVQPCGAAPPTALQPLHARCLMRGCVHRLGGRTIRLLATARAPSRLWVWSTPASFLPSSTCVAAVRSFWSRKNTTPRS